MNFQELQERFHVRLRTRLTDLTSLVETGAQPEPIMRAFHSLAGIGGTYGFDAITDESRACERMCLAVMEEGRPLSRDERLRLLEGIDRIGVLNR